MSAWRSSPWLASLLLGAIAPVQAQQDPDSPAAAPPAPQRNDSAQPPRMHMHEGAEPPAAEPGGANAGASGHVAPAPPEHPLPPMSSAGEMARMMRMGESATYQVLLEELEWQHTGRDDSGAWEGQAWYGGDYSKLWIKSEGERGGSVPEDARVELLWDRIVSRWWSLQAGAREDVDDFPGVGQRGSSTVTRTWAALGLQGVAPGWFDVEATFYVGEQGRTAARFRSTYDMLLTQRLILSPEIEANLESRSDPARLVAAGLTDVRAGLRLRYEIRRELAPYIGFAGTWRTGGTADRVRSAGYAADERGLVLGVRAWF